MLLTLLLYCPLFNGCPRPEPKLVVPKSGTGFALRSAAVDGASGRSGGGGAGKRKGRGKRAAAGGVGGSAEPAEGGAGAAPLVSVSISGPPLAAGAPSVKV